MTTTTTKLTGSALLEKVDELADRSKAEQVTACGYTSVKEDGYMTSKNQHRKPQTNSYAEGIKLYCLKCLA